MNEKKRAYFTRRKKEVEAEQSRRLGETAFLVGAAVVASKEDIDAVDVFLGGVGGLLIAGIFEVACPNVANIIKSVL